MSPEELINNLILDGYLKTPLIIQAFKKINRADFVPEKYKNSAYINEPLPIGENQTISQPLTVAFMLELLDPQPGEKILDIGSGSGWQTALSAFIVSQASSTQDQRSYVVSHKSSVISQEPVGSVIAVERILRLKAMTEENIAKYGFIEKGIAKAVWADGSKGAPPDLIPLGGFDKIIAAAALYPRDSAPSSDQRESALGDLVPKEWKEQLKIGGRIVTPVGHSIVVLDKISETEFNKEEHFGFSFVPLVSG